MKLKGICYMIASSMFFSLSAVLVKLVSDSFNSYFISVTRFIIGVILGLAVLLFSKKAFRVSDKKAWVIRGVAGSVSMILFYLAIEKTGSARATLMNNLYVIFVALLGFLLNKERMKLVNMISMMLCLMGVTIIFYDGGKYSLAGDIIGVFSGLIMGIAIHYTKRSSEKEHPAIVYMSACIFGLVFAPFSSVNQLKPGLLQFLLLLAIGGSSFLAQWLMTSSYSRISAIKGSLVSYLKIPFTVVIGILFGDRVSTKFYIGTAILIVGLLTESGIFQVLFSQNKKLIRSQLTKSI